MPEAVEANTPSTAISPGGDGGAQTDEEILGIGAEEPSSVEMETPQPEAEQQTVQQEETETEFTAGQPMPDWLKGLLKNAEQAPIAKEVQRLWDQHQAMRELVPTIQEARGWRETFPGGLVEAKAVVAKALELDEADAQFESGDPQYFAELHESNPQAFVQAFTQSAQLLAERDPNAYREIAGSVLRSTLESEKFPVHMDAMRQALEKDDVESLKELTKALVGWSGKMGITVKAEARLDPERQKFERERAAFNKEKQEAATTRFEDFNSKLISSATNEVRMLVEAKLTPILPKGMNSWAKGKLVDDVISSVSQSLAENKSHMKQVTNIIRSQGITDASMKQIVNLKAGLAKLMVSDLIKQAMAAYTGTAVNANKEKNAKENQAAARTDISGGAGPRPTGKQLPKIGSPEHRKMSDEDIINL